MEHADLVVLYLPELPGGIGERGDPRRCPPIQEVWLSAAKAHRVRGHGHREHGSEREAKLVALVLRLALVAWMRTQNLPNAAERLKAVSISADGTQVKLSGLASTMTRSCPCSSLLHSRAPAGRGRVGP